MNPPLFPSDTLLLPTQKGALLTSANHGIYCAVMSNDIEIVQNALLDPSTKLTPELEKQLKLHGFGGNPRPFRRNGQLLQFQVTNACNLRCAYCSADSGCKRAKELTLEDIKSVIDQGIALNPKLNISFTGGEPLLVPWIFDALDYALQVSPNKPGLLSNLLLLKDNDALCDRIADYIKRGVQVLMSISGSNKEVCNRLSGRACYDDAISVLWKLSDRDALPNLDIMMSAPDAEANIASFAAFRRSIPSTTKMTIGVLYPCGREKGEHVFKSNAELERVLDEITFEGGVSIPAKERNPQTNRRKACQCVEHENIYIRSDGGIFSCFKLVEQFGHISEGLALVMARRHAHLPLAANLKMCAQCPFVSLCAGGCRADNLILEKSVNAPICGTWRRQLIAELLFEDNPHVFDWSVAQQLEEARQRGIQTPDFVIESYHTQAGIFV